MKLVYKRYASLYFICGVDASDNELITLEIIHEFVEVLDRWVGHAPRRAWGLPCSPESHAWAVFVEVLDRWVSHAHRRAWGSPCSPESHAWAVFVEVLDRWVSHAPRRMGFAQGLISCMHGLSLCLGECLIGQHPILLCRYFGNVCELDLIFNFHKAYYILDELLIAGALACHSFIGSIGFIVLTCHSFISGTGETARGAH